jgi:formylglycine-generating enzyme required for sulfatase activity
MGAPASEKGRAANEELPQHEVTIAKPFAVGRFEVTFAEWDACYDVGGCASRAYEYGWGRGNQPVIYVNWNEAEDYVKWLCKITGKSYRLLSEAEYEYAARGVTQIGPQTVYPWTSSIGTAQKNHAGT